MANPFYTIGHSIRTIPEFVDLLREANVGLVVDVRTVPRSRANPQFNRDALPESLAGYPIGYEHLAELGGLRGRQRLIEPSPNGYWENASFLNYADYALTDRFREGLDRLTDLGSRSITAVVCAEAVWWRCHRRIIADHLSPPATLCFISSALARSSRPRSRPEPTVPRTDLFIPRARRPEGPRLDGLPSAPRSRSAPGNRPVSMRLGVPSRPGSAFENTGNLP
jgi:hypothetical protein